jgi:hypothetical protein
MKKTRHGILDVVKLENIRLVKEENYEIKQLTFIILFGVIGFVIITF